MRWAVVVLISMAGCAPVDTADPTAVTRQAFGPMPQFTGPIAGARLGASLAACPGLNPTFVVGAPGVGSVLLTDDAGFPSSVGNQLGRAVGCGGSVFAASVNGVDQTVGGTWFNLTPGSTVALAVSTFDGRLPLLVGQPPSVRFTNQTTGVDVVSPLIGSTSSFGSALAWAPNSQAFAVGSPLQQQVEVYTYANGNPFFVRALTDVHPEFGRAIAFGNLSPRPGIELIVAGRGVVVVYGEDGVFLFSIVSPSAGFGTALAVELDFVLNLDALWVGDPVLERVTQYIGNTGTPFTIVPANVAFGSSLAIADSVLAVGAPDFPTSTTQRGAVFTQDLRLSRPLGEPQLCAAGSCLTSVCDVGVCVGGVFCRSPGVTYGCASDDTCINGVCVRPDAGGMDAGFDAGAPDAGGTDAGAPDASVLDDAGIDDAGIDDAGIDAGARDAGVVDGGAEPELVVFVSRCSTGGAWPLVLGALVLLRRRRL